jgi:ketosteroid isomerase-like protein
MPATPRRGGTVQRNAQATGKSMNPQVCHVWSVSNGKLTKFQQYVDTAQLQDVMGAHLRV